MSRTRILLTTVVLVVSAIALSASSQAQCIPNNFANNWLLRQEVPITGVLGAKAAGCTTRSIKWRRRCNRREMCRS